MRVTEMVFGVVFTLEMAIRFPLQFDEVWPSMPTDAESLGVLTLCAWSYLVHERNAATSGDEQDLLQGVTAASVSPLPLNSTTHVLSRDHLGFGSSSCGGAWAASTLAETATQGSVLALSTGGPSCGGRGGWKADAAKAVAPCAQVKVSLSL